MLSVLWNIIDVILVAFLIYRLILLMKGTRAMQVLWGIILLASITIVAKLLDLNATAFMLHQFWFAGIVLLVIVFQPEIRSALAELGSKPLGRILESHEFNFIKELMDAVRYCSRRHIGILAVLEYETGLKDIVSTGILINGEVSKELLISLFFPKSPLHDGAVVVSNNRLVAAGCTLPMPADPDVLKVFGMRHRAAIGITENSDAVVVVVSEETGKVSLVRGGRIQSPVDTDEVEKRLYDLYKSKTERSLLRKRVRSEA